MENRCKELRLKANLSANELHLKTGIAALTLLEIEKGIRRLNIRIATILSQFYNVSVDYLLGMPMSVIEDRFKNSKRKEEEEHV